ncbi:MAG TPA: FAD:protein FMN transferase [Fimbriimonadaceae bacterium]|nr:FAD:protein FMN transferase [Fimbriimonadaceae bacterium]
MGATLNERGRIAGIALLAAWILTFEAVGSFARVQPDALSRFSYTEYHMGVDARLVVYARDRRIAETACAAAYERIAALDTMMSDYRKDSELNLLSDAAGGPPVRVSHELFKVLERAQRISRESGGCFDVTVGPVVQLWRKARKTGKLPDPPELAAARKLVGWRMVTLDPVAETVRLAKPGMRLDLGAIAKGYAADQALFSFKSHGIKQAMVDIGDIALGDPPPGKKGWSISIPDAGRTPALMLLSNCATSSSGDTEQHVIIGGREYSHVVDPHTGMALTNRVQATVIARDGFTSDPLSTCMTMLGPAGRKRMLKLYPGSKAFVRRLSLRADKPTSLRT